MYPHSTPALPSRREGREFLLKPAMVKFLLKSPSFLEEGGVRGEW